MNASNSWFHSLWSAQLLIWVLSWNVIACAQTENPVSYELSVESRNAKKAKTNDRITKHITASQGTFEQSFDLDRPHRRYLPKATWLFEISILHFSLSPSRWSRESSSEPNEKREGKTAVWSLRVLSLRLELKSRLLHQSIPKIMPLLQHVQAVCIIIDRSKQACCLKRTGWDLIGHAY